MLGAALEGRLHLIRQNVAINDEIESHRPHQFIGWSQTKPGALLKDSFRPHQGFHAGGEAGVGELHHRGAPFYTCYNTDYKARAHNTIYSGGKKVLSSGSSHPEKIKKGARLN